MKLIKIKDLYCNTAYIVKEHIAAIYKDKENHYNIVINGAIFTVDKNERNRIMRIINESNIALKLALSSTYGKIMK